MPERFAKLFTRKDKDVSDAQRISNIAEARANLAQHEQRMNEEAIANIQTLREEIIRESPNQERTRLYIDGLLRNTLTFAITGASPWEILEKLDIKSWSMPPTKKD